MHVHTVDYRIFALPVVVNLLGLLACASATLSLLFQDAGQSFLWRTLTIVTVPMYLFLGLFFLGFLVRHLRWVNVGGIEVQNGHLLIHRRLGRVVDYRLQDLTYIMQTECRVSGPVCSGDSPIVLDFVGQRVVIPFFVREIRKLAEDIQRAHASLLTDNGSRVPTNALASPTLCLTPIGFTYHRMPVPFVAMPTVGAEWNDVEWAAVGQSRQEVIIYTVKNGKRRELAVQAPKCANIHLLISILSLRKLLREY